MFCTTVVSVSVFCTSSPVVILYSPCKQIMYFILIYLTEHITPEKQCLGVSSEEDCDYRQKSQFQELRRGEKRKQKQKQKTFRVWSLSSQERWADWLGEAGSQGSKMEQFLQTSAASWDFPRHSQEFDLLAARSAFQAKRRGSSELVRGSEKVFALHWGGGCLGRPVGPLNLNWMLLTIGLPLPLTRKSLLRKSEPGRHQDGENRHRCV